MRRLSQLPWTRVLAIVAVAALGLAISPPADADTDGDALFAAQCADCHGARDVASWAEQYPEAAARRDWLDRFLTRHFPPAEDERALIIDHIEAVIAEQ